MLRQSYNNHAMKPKLILCLALILSGGLFGCSTTSNRSVETFSPVQLQNHAKEIFNKIEQQVPELGSTGMATGTSSPAEVWHGEEYASGGFFLLKNPTYISKGFSQLRGMSSRKPLPDLYVTIHHYVSSSDAQQDVQNSLRLRQAALPQKKSHEGAVLYKYHSGGGTVICEDGPYVIEINPGNNGRPFVMKVLDVVLAELNFISSKSK
jgi:hypothetical protein